ncbi:preprotein translocase subunit SecG [Opacimonas viscosa]|uniref:Protein-export membrane protein SecG n=1 Tax=Opacimonas viscosa TaxID=2961944 RepID=A0AA41X2F5_9ALTE|nr:preprotein translocase subunit SecG [Opacimonas viscosa]MCP3428778.1 preprotein translocase subunit SecG [Opacimonas viscosa]
MLQEVLIVAYLVVALLLIGLVLIQQGKGADMGASLGGGGSNTVFGSSGSGNFLTRSTAILATLFFVISLLLGNLTASNEKAVDEWENLEIPVTAPVELPAADVPVNTAPVQNSVPASDVPATSDTTEKEEGKPGTN